MKLLIVTQVIDVEHPILGFFHRWVHEFAKHCEHVHVICLEAGKYNLPANVTVHSLGKESTASKITYLLRFYRLIWQLRHEYDNVFVHMNQIYVILGGLFWRATGKKIGLWYMHGSTPLTLKIAKHLTHHIFTGSPDSFKLKSNKVNVTGHGIDTEHFNIYESVVDKDIDLITVGRITKAKNLMALVDILEQVRQQHDVSLSIVGAPVTEEEKTYQQELKSYIKNKSLEDHVHFVGRINQADLPKVLNRAKVFVTTAQNGSLDKAVLEAMACGLPVVSMAPGTLSLPLNQRQVKSTTDFVTQIYDVINSGSKMSDYASYVKSQHSIQSLVGKIVYLNTNT